MRYFLMTFMILAVISCSSTSQKISKDVVIDRIDNLPERPAWFSETLDTEESEEKIVFWGRSTLKEGERLEVGFRIAELNAKARIANYVSEKIRTISQVADEGSREDQTLFRGIISQRAKASLSQILGGRKYWEKVETSTASGKRELEYRIFQAVVIKKDELTKLVKMALDDGKGKLSQAFMKKVETEFDQMVSADKNEIH